MLGANRVALSDTSSRQQLVKSDIIPTSTIVNITTNVENDNASSSQAFAEAIHQGALRHRNPHSLSGWMTCWAVINHSTLLLYSTADVCHLPFIVLCSY